MIKIPNAFSVTKTHLSFMPRRELLFNIWRTSFTQPWANPSIFVNFTMQCCEMVPCRYLFLSEL